MRIYNFELISLEKSFETRPEKSIDDEGQFLKKF